MSLDEIGELTDALKNVDYLMEFSTVSLICFFKG